MQTMSGAIRVGVMAFITFAIAGSAHAEEAPLLVVTRGAGAEECPDSKALAETVSTLMGRAAFRAATGAEKPTNPGDFSVDITRGGLYTAIIHSAGGERELADPGPGCAG